MILPRPLLSPGLLVSGTETGARHQKGVWATPCPWLKQEPTFPISRIPCSWARWELVRPQAAFSHAQHPSHCCCPPWLCLYPHSWSHAHSSGGKHLSGLHRTQQGLAMQFRCSFGSRSAGREGRQQSRAGAEETLAAVAHGWHILQLWCILPAVPREHPADPRRAAMRPSCGTGAGCPSAATAAQCHTPAVPAQPPSPVSGQAVPSRGCMCQDKQLGQDNIKALQDLCNPPIPPTHSTSGSGKAWHQPALPARPRGHPGAQAQHSHFSAATGFMPHRANLAQWTHQAANHTSPTPLLSEPPEQMPSQTLLH